MEDKKGAEYLSAVVASHLFGGQSMRRLPIRSNKSSPAAVKISLRGVPGCCLNWMKSGREEIPGQLSSEGVPSAWKIFDSWSRSESPARKGTRSRSSARMHPTAQMSTPTP